MKKKHLKTLEAVFSRPPPANIKWRDVRSMLEAADVSVKDRSGSRVALVKDGEVMVVHLPHPEPEMGKATVKDIAAFLNAVGVEP